MSICRQTSEYRAYQNAKNRCENPKHEQYKDYGGRGVKVCFDSFEQFSEHIGPKPKPKHKYQLDRIDTNGHYAIGNVRWVTAKQNCRNKRNNHLLTVEGSTRTLSEWAELMGISKDVIRKRLDYGWTPEEAVTIDLGSNNHRFT